LCTVSVARIELAVSVLGFVRGLAPSTRTWSRRRKGKWKMKIESRKNGERKGNGMKEIEKLKK
jgi:hypothetical protein